MRYLATKDLVLMCRVLLRDLHGNKIPVNQISTSRSTERSRRSLNLQRSSVERSRNPSGWYTINPQIPKQSLILTVFVTHQHSVRAVREPPLPGSSAFSIQIGISCFLDQCARSQKSRQISQIEREPSLFKKLGSRNQQSRSN